MTWTPGPWKIDTDTQGYVVIVAGKRTVCLVGPEEDPTSETDAAAIVLLPELAEALKELRTAFLGTDLATGYVYAKDRKRIEYAMADAGHLLAKLEGGGK